MKNLQVSLPKIGKPLQFIKEVKQELKKVVWPSKKETVRLTAVVIIVCLVIGLYIGGLDLIFTKLMELVIK